MFAFAPAGQQPSPLSAQTIATDVHVALQLAAAPVRKSCVQALPSSQAVGQGCVLSRGSHSSPAAASTTPSPQLGEQSSSVFEEQSDGQQPSPATHCSMVCIAHTALQLAASPTMVARRQALDPAQLSRVGQVSTGSQVSSFSTIPLPQTALQSGSVLASPPCGQQPSSDAKLVMLYSTHSL